MSVNVKALHAAYITDPRRNAGASIGLPVAEKLVTLARGRVYADLGSGFSSLLLRYVARETGATCITTDGDDRWLEITRSEIKAAVLPEGWLMTQRALDRLHKDHRAPLVDLLLLDLGPMPFKRGVGGSPTRLARADLCAAMLAPGGVLVLDDWHRADYADAMGEALEARGLVVSAHPETVDDYGRYCATAERLFTPTTGTVGLNAWAQRFFPRAA